MSAHVVLKLLNELGKKIRCEALLSILSVFLNKIYQFNNTGAQKCQILFIMSLKTHCIHDFHTKTSSFSHK